MVVHTPGDLFQGALQLKTGTSFPFLQQAPNFASILPLPKKNPSIC